jgi:thiol-disulfide isomerase/thioredoxin
MSRIQTLDQFNFYHALEETPGIAVVVITGPDCGACRMMKQALQVLLELGEALTVYEVDAEQDRGIADEFGVFHLPGLFVYRDGHYHAPLEVEALPEKITQGIEAVLAAPAQEAP